MLRRKTESISRNAAIKVRTVKACRRNNMGDFLMSGLIKDRYDGLSEENQDKFFDFAYEKFGTKEVNEVDLVYLFDYWWKNIYLPDRWSK